MINCTITKPTQFLGLDSSGVPKTSLPFPSPIPPPVLGPFPVPIPDPSPSPLPPSLLPLPLPNKLLKSFFGAGSGDSSFISLAGSSLLTLELLVDTVTGDSFCVTSFSED